jgi:hypothetical protein
MSLADLIPAAKKSIAEHAVELGREGFVWERS